MAGDSKQQVVVIHGGTSFDAYGNYLSFLKTRELSLDKLKHRFDWKASLAKELGEEYEVLQPKMPNGTNARFAEWSIWLGRCVELLKDHVILIGHSLGGIFLAKYLAEQELPVQVKATILVAAPFDDEDAAEVLESLADFRLPASLEKFEGQGGKIYLLHSEDDPVVPVEQLKKYQQALPQAETVTFKDRGHFNQEELPELIEIIRAVE